MESYFIKKFNSHCNTGHGYNSTMGGDGILGHKMSEESKQKMSVAKLLDPNTSARSKLARRAAGDKCISPEANEKRSKSLKDYYRTNTHYATGTTLSDEHKAKISAKLKGRPQPPGLSQKVAESLSQHWEVTFPNGNKEIIKNMSAFCREHGLWLKHHQSITPYCPEPCLKARLRTFRENRDTKIPAGL